MLGSSSTSVTEYLQTLTTRWSQAWNEQRVSTYSAAHKCCMPPKWHVLFDPPHASLQSEELYPLHRPPRRLTATSAQHRMRCSSRSLHTKCQHFYDPEPLIAQVIV